MWYLLFKINTKQDKFMKTKISDNYFERYPSIKLPNGYLLISDYEIYKSGEVNVNNEDVEFIIEKDGNFYSVSCHKIEKIIEYYWDEITEKAFEDYEEKFGRVNFVDNDRHYGTCLP